MNPPKTATAAEVYDPVLAAFENAKPLDRPLTPEEAEALDRAMDDDGSAIGTDELLERLRPKL